MNFYLLKGNCRCAATVPGHGENIVPVRVWPWIAVKHASVMTLEKDRRCVGSDDSS
jgi:hypothetical protein